MRANATCHICGRPVRQALCDGAAILVEPRATSTGRLHVQAYAGGKPIMSSAPAPRSEPFRYEKHECPIV
jgi:hypothetical protein